MAEKFEAWGIVEIMGHNRTAGRLTEEMIAGTVLLRVDVPIDKDDPSKFRTEYIGPNSIFRLRVTDEQIARAAALATGRLPDFPYEISHALHALAPPRQAVASTAEDHEHEVEEDDISF